LHFPLRTIPIHARKHRAASRIPSLHFLLTFIALTHISVINSSTLIDQDFVYLAFMANGKISVLYSHIILSFLLSSMSSPPHHRLPFLTFLTGSNGFIRVPTNQSSTTSLLGYDNAWSGQWEPTL
jgi:hypothetical protein